VVANEVRALAERTKTDVDKIAGLTASLTTMLAEMTDGMRAVEGKLHQSREAAANCRDLWK
ncbi:MAG: chemotaxis protein, partial [Pseudomonadota bacterium]